MATSARAGRLIGQFWLYTLLRIVLFGVVWGVLWLVNVRGMLGLLIAVLLSVPLSFVLLARPRAALAAALEQRVAERREREDSLRLRLAGESGSPGGGGGDHVDGGNDLDDGGNDLDDPDAGDSRPARDAGPKRKDRRG